MFLKKIVNPLKSNCGNLFEVNIIIICMSIIITITIHSKPIIDILFLFLFCKY